MSMKAIAAPTTLWTRNYFLDLLKSSTTPKHLTQLHAHLLHNAFLPTDLVIATKLTHKLFEFGSKGHARRLFLSIPNPDLFLYNVLIKGLSGKYIYSSLSIFNQMKNEKNSGLFPDNHTYSFLISAVSGFGVSRVVLSLHGMAIVSGFGSDLFLGSVLIDFYLKNSNENYALKVFDRLSRRDTILCNTLISGFVRNSRFEESIKVFKEMMVPGSEVEVNCTTVIAVLPAVAELKELNLGMGIQCLSIKCGFTSHVSVLTGLILLYSKCGFLETARTLFKEIVNSNKKDLISVNAMISGCNYNGDTESSVNLFKEWVFSGDDISSSTMVGLIPVYSPFGYASLSKCIHGLCVKSGFVSNSSVSTALITVYSRLNEMEFARKLFDESSVKSLQSWNAIITGYTQNGLTEAAVSLFQEMQLSNVSPNPITATSILSACAQLGTLSLGKWVHNLARKNNFEGNIFISTALVDMYAKCGSIEEARELFDSMRERNEVTWNAMICGYGLHGLGHEALKLFNEMLSFGCIRPNEITFLCALYACSHAGLVNEGTNIFHLMVDDYGIKPIDEHYACMVDILGRAGKLQKALEFINSMPNNPGPPVWGSFLGACKIHRNTSLARLASDKLLELDPENVGYYVSMSNIYSSKQNYSQAASVRQVANKRNLAKAPGCTVIELDKVPHVFISGDRSHPRSREIYAELERLNGKMQEAGFRSEGSEALHDVEEEEKELMVKVHSEKLAIAFGIISTEPGTEIRIIKNLRVCLDCHSATKFISKITQRVIVVRDANRFHHFKDGVCSCGDYW